MPHWTGAFPLGTDIGIAWDFGVRALWCEVAVGQVRAGWSDPERDELDEVVVTRWREHRSENPSIRVAAAEPAELHLAVVPCPRPIVARPEVPLTVPARSGAVVFVGVPLWLVLSAGGVQVVELAAIRLSDTWFGDPTDGVLCYATRTRLRMELEHIPRRPYRALCQIRIRNDTDQPKVLERLRIPAPSLSVYEAANGVLWTSDLSYVAIDSSDHARLRIGDGPPEAAPEAVLLAAAREKLLPLARVFNALWRSGL